MNLGTLLDMACAFDPDRVAIGPRPGGITFGQLAELANKAAIQIHNAHAQNLVFVGVNGPVWPLALFAAAAASVPVVPLNYRFSEERLRRLASQIADPFIVANECYLSILEDVPA